MYKKVTHSSKRGFTLNELLVVIAIIGILAGIVIANLNPARENAQNSKISTDISSYTFGLRMYKERHGNYPPNLGDLTHSTRGVLGTLPTAPNGITYSYTQIGAGSGYRLSWSLFGESSDCTPGVQTSTGSNLTNCEYVVGNP